MSFITRRNLTWALVALSAFLCLAITFDHIICRMLDLMRTWVNEAILFDVEYKL